MDQLIVRLLACAAASATCFAQSSLLVTDRVDILGVIAKEPMVVEHPDGPLFVSGFGPPRGLKLWKSLDYGGSWSRVNVGTEADGASGNSDVDLAIARDGTIYFVTMEYDNQAHEGRHITVGVSKNQGATWRWTMLSEHRFDDRPWVAVAVDGTAHVIWNDGSGVNHAVSKDKGVTWLQKPRINGQGGSSHLAVGPDKEVAVRVTPSSASGGKFDAGVDLIAVSTDAGVTWKNRPAPGHRDWNSSPGNGPPRWVEPLAWDAQGALYSLWADGKALWLAQSVDQGETWTSWQLTSGDEDCFYPYLVARGRGELAASWFSGRRETLQAHVAVIHIQKGIAPRKAESAPFRVDWWQNGPTPEAPLVRGTGGEYVALTFLKSGGLAMVSPIANTREQRLGFSWWRLEAR